MDLHILSPKQRQDIITLCVERKLKVLACNVHGYGVDYWLSTVADSQLVLSLAASLLLLRFLNYSGVACGYVHLQHRFWTLNVASLISSTHLLTKPDTIRASSSAFLTAIPVGKISLRANALLHFTDSCKM